MTKDEAIRELDKMWKMLTSAYDDIADTYVVAYTMAVEALRAQDGIDTNVGRKDGDCSSKQAAIDALKDAESHVFNAFYKGLVKALKIVADLPSVQPEPKPDENGSEPFGNAEKLGNRTTDDLISRQAAIDAAIEAADDWDGGYSRSREETITKRLSALPSVQPEQKDCDTCRYNHLEWDEEPCDGCTGDRYKTERKRGEWHKRDNGQIYWYECSCCGCEPLRNKWNGEPELSDFCPTCGADMRGGKDESD